MQHGNPTNNNIFVIEENTTLEAVSAIKDENDLTVHIHNRSNIDAIKALPFLEYTDIVIAEPLNPERLEAIPSAAHDNIVFPVDEHVKHHEQYKKMQEYFDNKKIETRKRKFSAIIPTIEVTEAELKSSVSPCSRQPQNNKFLTVPQRPKRTNQKVKRRCVRTLFSPDPSKKNIEQSSTRPEQTVNKKGPQNQ